MKVMEVLNLLMLKQCQNNNFEIYIIEVSFDYYYEFRNCKFILWF